MLLAIAFCALGLALLTKAADQFVLGAARMSLHFAISPVVVGAVVVGFGTSAPEMVVSGIAAGGGELDLGVGNVVGSNVANLSLVLGVAALVTPLVVSAPTLRREAPLAGAAVVLFALIAQGGLSRTEGAVLAGLMVGTLGVLLWSSRGGGDALPGELDELAADRAELRVGVEAGRTLLGLAGTVAGAQLLVEGATEIAERAGLSSGFVGLTLVAIGTSLPELVTSVMAARRGETDLIVGNLLGSNIFNSFGVGAVMGLVGPGQIVDTDLEHTAMGVMVAVAALASVFMVSGRQVLRWEAAALLGLYLATLPLMA